MKFLHSPSHWMALLLLWLLTACAPVAPATQPAPAAAPSGPKIVASTSWVAAFAAAAGATDIYCHRT